MDLIIAIVIPEVHVEDFVNLLCIGGNYKEYIDDPEDVGEMIINPITKEEFAQAQASIVLFQHVKGQNHRRKEDIIRKAHQEAEKNESDLDIFLAVK